MWRRIVLGLLLLSVWTSSASRVGFEANAFNRACPSSNACTVVFSPASFEIDCALVAESLPTIPKAAVSVLLGVAIDFEGTYRPVLEGLEERTNGFSFVAARGFCVEDIRRARGDHRRHLEQAYGAEVVARSAAKGAESWFRATMEGEMEDFRIGRPDDSADGYGFYDLVSVEVAWRDPFPTANTRSLSFRQDASNAVQIACMSDVRMADTWETDGYTLLRLPLRNGAWFLALLPKADTDLSVLRRRMTSDEMDRLMSVLRLGVGRSGLAHGPCAIVLPRFELGSRIDLSGAFRHFKIPTQGLGPVAGKAPAYECVQRVKFRLAEHARGEVPLVKKPDDEVVPITPDVKRLVFNRPFLFFVYHEKTETFPIAGAFTGR